MLRPVVAATVLGAAVGSLLAAVYQRRKHVINLFVAQHLGARHARTVAESIQGYNVRQWSRGGLDFWAVSDLAGDELDEFVHKIASAAHPSTSS